MKENAPRIEITNMTKGKLPSLPFAQMKEKVLGKKYTLSLAFIDVSDSKKWNSMYRGKKKPTDVLAFPLSKDSGEILINIDMAKKKALLAGKKTTPYIGFLFIHGLLHLKGMEHGSTMENKEQEISRFFSIS